VQEIHEV